MRTLSSAILLSALSLAVLQAADEKKADVEKGKNTIVKGRITSVNSDKHQFTLRSVDGRKMTFTVTDASKLQSDGQKVRLSDLKERWRVLVVYEPEGDTNRVIEMMPSYASASDVAKQFGQAFQSVKSFAFGKKEQVEDVLKNAVAEANDLIADLTRQSQVAGAKEKGDLADALKDLMAKKNELEKRIPQVAKAGAEGWEDLKTGIQKSLDDFEKAYEKVEAVLNKDTKNKDKDNKK